LVAAHQVMVAVRAIGYPIRAKTHRKTQRMG